VFVAVFYGCCYAPAPHRLRLLRRWCWLCFEVSLFLLLLFRGAAPLLLLLEGGGGAAMLFNSTLSLAP
jgi:hypothetical protein